MCWRRPRLEDGSSAIDENKFTIQKVMFTQLIGPVVVIQGALRNDWNLLGIWPKSR
jgi:hypothetical protein